MLTSRRGEVQEPGEPVYAPPAVALARLALLLALAAPGLAQAQGLSARFSNQVATLGAPLDVEVLVEDPIRAVDRVKVELRRADDATWTATTAATRADSGSTRTWVARYDAAALWPADRGAPKSLELRALLYGRRGGLLLVIGEIEPFEMDVLTPDRAAMRARALERPAETPGEPTTGADAFSLAGYVGAEGRLGSSARARAFIGAGGAIADTLELLGVVVVGPTFAEPADLSGGGPFALGFELALRAYVDPLEDKASEARSGPEGREDGSGRRRPQKPKDWNLFAQPFLTGEARLPGFDAGGGLRAGALYWVSNEVAVEASLGGALMGFGLVTPEGETKNLGFSGGLRVGVRFGPERQ